MIIVFVTFELFVFSQGSTEVSDFYCIGIGKSMALPEVADLHLMVVECKVRCIGVQRSWHCTHFVAFRFSLKLPVFIQFE